LPDRIAGLLDGWVHQGERPLKVLAEIAVGDGLQIPEQTVVEPLRFVGVSPTVENDERLAQFRVRRLVECGLPEHHDAAEGQHCCEDYGKFALEKKAHGE